MEARKRSLILILLLLVSFNSALMLLQEAKSSGPPLTVGGPEPDSYPTIQSAIDAAIDYDNIEVYPGTYEETLTIDKTVGLHSWDRENTIISGDGKGDVINITGFRVHLQGFTIRNSGPEGFGAGIVLYDTGMCSIVNVDASQNYYYGIVVYSSSWNRIIYNNFSDEKPPASGLRGWGIYLHSSSYNNVSLNTVLNNEVGIRLNSSDMNTITENTLSDNHYGLRGGGDENTIANNLISSNDWGIVLHGENNSFVENTIKGNRDGILLGGSRNKLFHNSFIENWGDDAIEGGTDNQWDNGYPQGGNYWDEHKGIDEKNSEQQSHQGKDGIGDVAMPIAGILPGFDTEDRYPLLSPFVAPPSPPGNALPVVSVISQRNSTHLCLAIINGTANDPDGEIEYVEFRSDDRPWVRFDNATSWVLGWSCGDVFRGKDTVYFRSFDGTSLSNVNAYVGTIELPETHDTFGDFFLLLNGMVIIIIIGTVLIYATRRKR